MYTHSCINKECSAQYQSEDEDPYYCETCLEKKKVLAEEIDAKRALSQPEERPKSDYQILLEKGQTKGQSTFVKAADLGITF